MGLYVPPDSRVKTNRNLDRCCFHLSSSNPVGASTAFSVTHRITPPRPHNFNDWKSLSFFWAISCSFPPTPIYLFDIVIMANTWNLSMGPCVARTSLPHGQKISSQVRNRQSATRTMGRISALKRKAFQKHQRRAFEKTAANRNITPLWAGLKGLRGTSVCINRRRPEQGGSWWGARREGTKWNGAGRLLAAREAAPDGRERSGPAEQGPGLPARMRRLTGGPAI